MFLRYILAILFLSSVLLSSASATFTLTTPAPSIQNPGFENAIDTEWDCFVANYTGGGSWSYKKKITVNAHQHISGNLSNEPVLVHVTSSDTHFWSNTRSDGKDVKFTSLDGATQFEWEVESWDSTGDDAWYWVQVPTLSSSAATEFYMWYGNPSQDTPLQSWSAYTWDGGGYLAVYHLNQDLKEPNGISLRGHRVDSSDWLGIAYNTLWEDDAEEVYRKTVDTTGQIDRARGKTSQPTKLESTNTTHNLKTARTIEVWFKTSSSTYQYIVGSHSDADPGYWMTISSGNITARFSQNDTTHSSISTSGTNYADNQWHHAVMTIDTAGDGYTRIYMDGALAGTSTSSITSIQNIVNGASIMGYKTTGSPGTLIGWIDEISFSTAVRSLDWVKMRYQNGLQSWVSIGSEESAGGGNPCSVSFQRVTTPTAQSGTYSVQLAIGVDDAGATWDDAVEQALTIPANTAIDIQAYLQDNGTYAYGKMAVYPNAGMSGTAICSAQDTPSNSGVWTQKTCSIPSNNTDTSVYLVFVGTRSTDPVNTKTLWVDNVTMTLPSTGDVTLILPSGSTGRVVSFYDDGGTHIKEIVGGDTSAIMTSMTAGTYFWKITDTDGRTFFDNSDFVTVNPFETWTWANSNLAKDATWDLVLHGDADANGNCLDNGANGCYHTITRNGSDYLDLGPRLGSNLAAGKTATVSSGSGASNITDGDKNTYWTASTSSNEWACIDFGSSTTFNRIILFGRNANYNSSYSQGYGPDTYTVKVSDVDTDCSSGNWTAVVTHDRFQRGLTQQSHSFVSQTKRFVRLDIATFLLGTPNSLQEIEIYNEGGANLPSALERIVLNRQTSGGGDGTPREQISEYGIRWDSYTTESDSSKTFTKALSGGGFTATLIANYKKIADTWRVRYSLSSSVPTYAKFASGIMKYMSSGTPCVAGEPRTPEYNAGDEVDSCDQKVINSPSVLRGPPTTALILPYAFTVASDAGCYGKYQSNSIQPYSTHDDHSHDVSMLEHTPNWVAGYAQYGHKYDPTGGTYLNGSGLADLKISSTPVSIDVAITRSVDPDPEYAVMLGVASLADAKGKTNFDIHNKLLYASALGRYVSFPDQQHCVSIHHRQHAKGAHPVDNSLSVVGINDKDVVLNQIYAWRRGDTSNSPQGVYIDHRDTMGENLTSTPSFVTPNKNLYNEGIIYMLAYAKTRGWLTVKADCANTDMTCISTAERDELYTNLNSRIPSNGEVQYGFGAIIPGEATPIAYASDVFGWITAEFYVAYKGMEVLGASIDQTKLNNLKTTLQSLYDTTDGYIHLAKYGTWRSYAGAGSSGNSYKMGQPEFFSPTTARFVVPSGHTNASLSFTYIAGPNNGKVTIKKNGVSVTESPVDQYGSFWSGYDINYEDYYVSAGTLKAVGISARANYGANQPAELQGHSWMIPHTYDIADFSGINNKLRLRVKSYTNGPTGVVVLFTDGVTCTGLSWSCYQYFPNVITADGTWQEIELTMTGTWGTDETIGMLRFDYTDQTDSTGTVEVDWIRKFDGSTETSIDEFSVEGPAKTQVITETVSTGDVLTFEIARDGSTYNCQKNASASVYCRMTLDKITIGGTGYEENHAGFQCPSDLSIADCKDGYTQGWKRWQHGKLLFWINQMKILYGEEVFTDEQILSHIEKQWTPNNGNGTFGSAVSSERGTPLHTAWFGGSAGGNANPYSQFNFSSWLIWDAHTWFWAATSLGDPALWYRWDEKTDKVKQTVGTWTDEIDPATDVATDFGYRYGTYYAKRVWKSSTAGHTLEFKNVSYSDVELYFISGSGQGTVKVYFANNGGSYDAGTTIDLSTGQGGGTSPTMMYSQTGQAYSASHKIKIEVMSGTVRLDYIRTKTKASDLLQYRFDEEFGVRPIVQNYLFTDWANTSYYRQTGFYSSWSHLELMYRGTPLSGIKRKWFFENMHYRRLAQ